MGDGLFEPTPQELVMTLLGSHVHPRESASVWSGGLVALLGELGFSAGAARIALSRLAQRGLLERHRQGRLVHYTLTSRTVAVLAEGDRRIFSLGRDDRAATQWTLLWHAVPDARRTARDRLVRRLRFLGFGSLQDGTWLAARDLEHEVVALLDELGIAEHAGMLVGRPAASLAAGPFIARAWDLDGLAGRYAAFVRGFQGVDASVSAAEAFALRVRLVHTFRQFAALDPELPAALVPPPAERAAAVALFHDLYAALAPAAQRHFDRVVKP